MENKFDVMIVLGYRSDDGISEVGKQRVGRAVKIYMEKRSKIILSGGFALRRKKGGSSEAELMKRYAIESGVDPEDILVEDKSRDTQGNAYFSKQIVMENNWKSVLVVTSDFHLIKARLFFDYIYGKNYDLSYVGVDANLSDEEIVYNKESDQKSIDFMEKVYPENGIERGEDDKVGVIIKDFYERRGQ